MNNQRGFGSNRDLTEGFQELLGSAARFLVWAGAVVSVGTIGFLIYTSILFSGGDQTTAHDAGVAMSNIALLQKLLVAGVLAAGVGATVMFWGEELLGAAELGVALLVFFLPAILGASGAVKPESASGVPQAALGAITLGGGIFGVIAIIVLVIDIAQRAQLRIQQGSKADQIKLGKGIKEEADRQNVFLGKCWQLPFCRKFVRDRCPIYHSKRTCWKELVGCMCEEEVIRNAMENKTIPKDMVAAANYIPKNNKLSFDQKRERCKTCVIYNEHQKHKYKALLPSIWISFILLYALLREPLLAATGSVVEKMSRFFNVFTFQHDKNHTPPPYFQEMLLICIMLVIFVYAVKLLEYLIFKLKV